MSELKNALIPGTLLTSGNQTYRVVKALGAGGFGITYLVEAQTIQDGNVISFFYCMKEHFLNRCCERSEGSSKVIYSNPVADEVQNSQRDFIAEATRLQKLGLHHDNIVKVTDIFEANNTAYYVMEFLQGNSLRDYVSKRGRLNEAEMLQLTMPILDAIGFLHANHLTHLDIKPDNIMLTPDPTGKPRPVLIDFGLSKHYDPSGRPTSTINTLGCSDGYSPIEQYGGITTFQPTADIYSLGATMAYCITGQNPKKSTDMVPGEAANYTAGLSPQTANAIVKMMDMNRAQRPQSVAEVYRLLKTTTPPPAPSPAPNPGTVPLPNPGNGPMVPPPPVPPPPVYPPRPVGAGKGKGNNSGKKALLIGGGIVAGLALLIGLIVLIAKGGNDLGPHAYDRGDVISEYLQPDVSTSSNSALEDEILDQYNNCQMVALLGWNRSTDLDLYAVEPDGTTIYFLTTSSERTGGHHQGDNMGGSGSREAITWMYVPEGEYDFFVSVRSINEGERIPVDLAIKKGDTYKTYSATLEYFDDETPRFYKMASVDVNSTLGSPDDAANYVTDYGIGDVVDNYLSPVFSPVSDASAVQRLRSYMGNATMGVGIFWDSSNDFDLIVNQPDASYIWYRATSDSSTGASFRQDSRGGSGSYECIKWTRPTDGRYDIFASIFSLSSPAELTYVLIDGSNVTTRRATLRPSSESNFYKIEFYQRGGAEDVIPESAYADTIAIAEPARQEIQTQEQQNTNNSRRNTPNGYAVINANGSTSSYVSGEAVDNYVDGSPSRISDSYAVSRSRNIGGSGPLKMTLLWDFSSDLDLIVNQANGKDIYFSNTSNDDTYGGHYSGDSRGGSGSAESVWFTSPGDGIYDAFVRCRNLPSGGGDVKLVVTQNGTSTVYAAHITGSGSGPDDVRLANFRYTGTGSSSSSSSSSNSGSIPTTYASSSTNSFSSGDAVSSFVEANTSTAYDSNAVSRASSVGSNGTLKITLLWDFDGDCDLIVNQPTASDVYYGRSSDSSYGALYSGDNTGGNGSYESIRWTNPDTGIYDVFVRVRRVPSSGGVIKVVIKDGGSSRVYSTRISKSDTSMKDFRMAHFTR